MFLQMQIHHLQLIVHQQKKNKAKRLINMTKTIQVRVGEQQKNLQTNILIR